MAVKTVTQDDFMIFRKVQKDTRRSSKEVLLNSNQAGLRSIEKRPTLQSIYRGVCSNGNKWQSMVLEKGCKYYSASLCSQTLAAQVYDRFVIES